MIAPMTKIQLIIPDGVRDDFLRWLQQAEIFHVADSPLTITNPALVDSDTNYQLAQLEFAIEFIDKVRDELGLREKRSWRDRFKAQNPIADLEELEENVQALNLEPRLKEIRQLSEELAEITTQQQELKTKVKQFTPWYGLVINTDQKQLGSNVRHVFLEVGLQEEEHITALLDSLRLAAWHEVHKEISDEGGRIYLEVVAAQEESQQLDRLIQATGAEVIDLDLAGATTVAERVAQLKKQLAELDKKHADLIQKATSVVELEPKLKLAYDALLNRQEREKLQEKLVRSDSTASLSGWIPAKKFDRLQKVVEEKFPTVTVTEEKSLPNEQPPVLFQNSKLMQPFEAVTNVYGKPKYTELDPSPFLSIFFLIAFGFALTDAGYGLIIMVATWAAQRFMRIKRETRKMMQLMFYGGLITVILGALTGGWFGVVLEELPAGWLKDFLLSMKLIDPVTQPIQLLIIALAIGVVQLLFASLVKAYHRYQEKDYMGILIDDLAWISLILAIFAWVAAGRDILIPSSLTRVMLYWIYASAIVLILFKGRANKNIFARLGSGVLSLYGLLGFLSDVLSYSRLLALGLATGIIGLVVNLIAGLVNELVPVVGIVLAILVLVIGHIANLAINTLGAFIHGSRLQFVEFFPKFLEGGGLAYRPFGRVSKYVDNPNEYN